MSPQPTTGTTLEILAPYLLHKIPLATPQGSAKLVGLNYGSYQCPVETLDGEARLQDSSIIGGLVQYDYADVLPMLRPFKQLQDRLPDGTSPAVVINNMVGGQARHTDTIYYVGSHSKEVEERIDFVRNGQNVGSLTPHFTTSGRFTFLRVADYLRSLHFAVGLEAHQYIVKEAGK